MLYKYKNYFIFLILILSFAACKQDTKHTSNATTDKPASVKVPKFQGDSAFAFVEKQVSFGPRVPNTPAHTACKNWLANQLRSYGAKLTEQSFTVDAYTGEKLHAVNIIGSFHPKKTKRIVLAAHWDSRHIADQDSDEQKKKEPILGADDGASGVAVLLEIARLLKDAPIDLGVDIVLFDVEDYGENGGNNSASWCLGSQYWSRQPHIVGYKAKYGILLDMVGAKNARFGLEAESMRYAPQLMQKIWKLAQDLGYGNYFVSINVPGITDDHVYVNRIAGIPMIDIINRPATSSSGFVSHWHTHKDNMDIIDKRTLRAVGQVLLNVIYKEDKGKFQF